MPPLRTGSRRTPKLSVVMPMRNSAGVLRAALASVLNQQYDDDFEVIAVDNGSTDHTRDVARDFAERVTLIEKAGTVAAARNEGIAAARGEYLVYCDSDDVQHPFRFRVQAAALDRFRDAGLVCSDFSTWKDDVVLSESHLRTRWLGPSTNSLDDDLARSFRTVTTCRALGLQ
ncbi:MAG TPA: glycosyltransferase family A protein, partial [Actinomycetota bacterium]|nr:glycosyltransferase family A protein [Actinomycetota bacterium]